MKSYVIVEAVHTNKLVLDQPNPKHTLYLGTFAYAKPFEYKVLFA